MMNFIVAIGFLALAAGVMSQASDQSEDDRFALVRARALGMSVYGELWPAVTAVPVTVTAPESQS